MDHASLSWDILREKLGNNGIEIQKTSKHDIEYNTQNKMKKYPCTLCDTVCLFPSDLQRHMRKHTGEKPFACDQCDAKYSQKAHLQKHQKSHALKDLMLSIQETTRGGATILPPPPASPNGENYVSPNDFLQVSMDESVDESMPINPVLQTQEAKFPIRKLLSPGKKTFACHYCDYICKQKTHLDVHLRTHTGEKPFACTICDYACARQGQLKLHLAAHSEFPPIPCPHCHYKFARETHLIKHMRVHIEEGVAKQSDAYQTRGPFQTLNYGNEIHDNHNQVTNGGYLHDQGDANQSRGFLKVAKFANEIHDKHDIGTNGGSLEDQSDAKPARDCYQAVEDGNESYDNINKSTNGESLQEQNGNKEINQHFESENSESPHDEIGNGVDHEENREIDLGQFLEVSMDEETEPYKNNWWESKDRPETEELNSRLPVNPLEGKLKGQFACNVCGYVCRQRGHLDVHMRIHTGEKPYTCGECDYSAASVSQLNRHLQVHIKEKTEDPIHPIAAIPTISPTKPISKGKRLICPICNYACKTNQYFTIHMRIHTGEKPFKCTECAYACAGQQQLKRHMLIHTGEKPFACSVCDYKSARRADLTKHMMIHTNEKPFSCDKCDYNCIRKETLKIHELTHLQTNEYDMADNDDYPEELRINHSLLA